MNYLAHIYLARHSDRAMLGAMLGDFVRADFAGKYGAEMETEILIHRKVDAYTDSHPVVKAAREKFESGRRRFAGIVLDVFYDHALAQNWSSYCGIPLDDFIGDFYRALLENRALLPQRLAEIVPMIVDENWLGSYRDIAGFETTVRRISRRLSRNGDLVRDGLLDVRENYAFLCDGFDEFFPQLIRFAEAQRASMQASGS